MTAAVIALSISQVQSSGAAGVPSPSAYSRAQDVSTAVRVSAPDRCPSVQKALRFYTERWKHWTQLRGAGRENASGLRVDRRTPAAPCPRYLLKIRKRKAEAARKEWHRWFHYHYAWSEWLPDKWQRIGACETGYGRRPGNWRHYNATYQGAFGFHRQSWDAFVPRADPKAGPYPSDAHLATPRQQYEVALAIWRMYGFSGWGCRGA